MQHSQPPGAAQAVRVRPAMRADIDALAALIDESIRTLHRDDYPPRQIDLALAHVYGVDTVLIDDGTYAVVEEDGRIVACGGWSKRATLCGGDKFGERSNTLLDPTSEPAKIRAFYVRPSHVRRGLASLLLEACEREALQAGFRRAELGATLTGARFYAARGYLATGRADVLLPSGELLAVVHMQRALR